MDSTRMLRDIHDHSAHIGPWQVSDHRETPMPFFRMPQSR